nr:Uncharacterised protein [Raoultella sp. NCTC 9187]
MIGGLTGWQDEGLPFADLNRAAVSLLRVSWPLDEIISSAMKFSRLPIGVLACQYLDI